MRREILEAAGELFATEGYESVSMRRIADRINYSPAALYLYFKDKSDLLHQLGEDTFSRLTQYIHECKDGANDPLDGLLRGTRGYIEFGLTHPHQYIVTFISPPGRQHDAPDIPFEGSMGEACFQGLEEAIAACVKAGLAPAIDVKTTACTWWAAIHGLTSLLIAHDRFPWADREEMTEKLLQALTAGLLTAPVGERAGTLSVEQRSVGTSKGGASDEHS